MPKVNESTDHIFFWRLSCAEVQSVKTEEMFYLSKPSMSPAVHQSAFSDSGGTTPHIPIKRDWIVRLLPNMVALS